MTETLHRVISFEEIKVGDVVELTAETYPKWLTQAEVTFIADGDVFLVGHGWVYGDWDKHYRVRLLERN